MIENVNYAPLSNALSSLENLILWTIEKTMSKHSA